MTKKLYRSKKAISLALLQAEKHKDELAKQLQEASVLISNERQQEENLQAYKKDYMDKISLQQDCSITHISRYRTFCHQLDDLITQQLSKIAAIEAKRGELNQLLYLQQYRIKTLKKRDHKNQQQIDAVEEKQQQKIMDELSTIRYSKPQY